MVRRWKFSTQVAFIYTLIIAIPLSMLIIGVSQYVSSNIIASMFQDSERIIDEQSRSVEQVALQMEHLESVITSDFDLKQFLYLSTPDDTIQTIEKLIYHTKILERITFTQPLIYKVYIFVHNQAVPERWPLVYQEDRFSDTSISRWVYNYYNRITSAVDLQVEKAVYLTGELELQKRHVGYVQIGVRMTDFFPFLYQTNDHTQSGKTIVFNKDKPVLSETEVDPNLIKTLNQNFPEADHGSWRYKVRGDEYILAFRRIPRLDLTLVHWRSAKSLLASIGIIRFVSVSILILSILVMFLIISGATNRLFKRLYLIMHGLREVRDGNLKVHIQVDGTDEVAEMASIFTAMVTQINALIETSRQEHELLAQTHIKAMQNQINAHFLYNALETIKMQAELKDEADLVESITILGRLMRYSLKLNKHQVTLAQELEYISDYIRLMNIRNDYTITLEYAIPEPFLKLEIPKMLIQPVVENAVMHGIEPVGEDAHIQIACTADTAVNRWFITIHNTGREIDERTLQHVRLEIAEGREREGPSGGIGLVNIQQRLWAFYGETFKVTIESGQGRGTRVTIPLPLPEDFGR
ncbi:MAG TPA: histidine kinase [Treponema sp.]|nr:histidine kinase [Treponema sp.]HPC72033.1 histidine kinase [Treponema sp.]HRS04469.1 histidine kinase [Treponema sp.]HRU29682.1 histidine kinase [Treponema sp.]